MAVKVFGFNSNFYQSRPKFLSKNSAWNAEKSSELSCATSKIFVNLFETVVNKFFVFFLSLTLNFTFIWWLSTLKSNQKNQQTISPFSKWHRPHIFSIFYNVHRRFTHCPLPGVENSFMWHCNCNSALWRRTRPNCMSWQFFGGPYRKFYRILGHKFPFLNSFPLHRGHIFLVHAHSHRAITVLNENNIKGEYIKGLKPKAGVWEWWRRERTKNLLQHVHHRGLGR